MASIGSRSAAFLAGYQPKNTPVTVHTAKERNTLHGWMKMGQWATLFTIQLAPHPMMTPMMPPVMLMRIASMRNWLKMSTPRGAYTHAQADFARAFRHRYVHDVHIADAATTSEMPAMQASSVVIRSVVEFSMVLSSCWLRMVKSSSSLSFSLWLRRSISVIFVGGIVRHVLGEGGGEDTAKVGLCQQRFITVL